MEFRISDTFTDSLAKLTGDEQKAAKTTAFDLQMNPANPGLKFHKLDRARDKNFWSVRVSRDIRLIVHKSAASLLLCYVNRHDAAYAWAERRRIERHVNPFAMTLCLCVSAAAPPDGDYSLRGGHRRRAQRVLRALSCLRNRLRSGKAPWRPPE